jgi:hypothetical protein
VELDITSHAFLRFRERWSLLHKISSPVDLHAFITEKFSHAGRIKNHSREEKKRLKRYGSDTLYFRNNDWTFIVQDAKIITIEISNQEQRHSNKRA